MADAYTLTLYPYLQAFDADGNALAGGQVFAYQAGTSTPITTYADPARTVPNSWPVILDGQGQAPIYVVGPLKLVIEDSEGNLIRTHDNILGITSDVVSQVSGQPQFQVTMNGAAAAFLAQNFGGFHF
jgi:hypothetical protein